ncbi:NAD(P)/FAD-dependent oxidoreductase [Streptomyces arenae]|uniref:NAD(P)/FAD-dependent oxidoreductase n=1 Tax=Streptomyces arenae TaxID=29301 RepID=UPI00265957BD|nr:FAD-dependent oxidoreductase [Streptomyces arenae]MCG7207377.1 FAD-dependent oxidoreductase [Streptomyces arenae]
MSEHYDVLIVGAGQAGAQVAGELADAGFPGTVGIVGAEDTPPYERPPLSKGYLSGEASAESLLLRPADRWAADGAELLLGTEVIEVDPSEHMVTTAGGERLGYGRLVWAAGGRARILPVPGADLDGVHYVRTLADADRLKTQLPTARRAVVIGGGFIGLEAAAAFAKAGLDVTVVEAMDRLLGRVTSPVVSEFFAKVHGEHQVDVLFGHGVTEITGSNGAVKGVALSDGRTISADIVVVGVGLVPNVEPIIQAGAVGANGVEVDESGRTTLPDVFAAGDCANFANAHTRQARMRLESVQNAVEQGRAVARAILGMDQPSPAVPWFWSNQYDIKFKTMGILTGYDTSIVRGDPSSGRFSVVYLLDGAVIAVDTLNNVRDYAQAKVLIKSQAQVDPAAVADPTVQLKDLVAKRPADVA